jgi:hypothetical protein
VKTRIAVALVAALAIGGVLSVSALGALPKPKHALVVPFQKIGPIKFGTKKATAMDKWGSAQCSVGTGGRDTCVWLSSSPSDFPEEGTVLELSDGKVCGMEMRAGENFQDDSLTITRLAKWKTKEGVGLGSKMKAAKHLLGGQAVVTHHGVTTAFFAGDTPSTTKLVGTIEIFKKDCPVT